MRRLGASVLATALLVGSTACNGDDAASGDGHGRGESGQRAAAAGLTKDNVAQTMRDAQAAARSAHIEATVESQGQTLELAGDVDHLDSPRTPALDFSVDLGGDRSNSGNGDNTVHLLVVDKVLYVSGSGLFGTQEKLWMKVDVSDATNPFSQLFQAANPGNFASYLDGATAFKDDGLETVDGVSTRHYTVTVDTAKMLAANPVFKGQDASRMGLPETVTSELYVDEDGRPVEIKVDLAATGAFEAHFSDYGKPVHIEAPPPHQVGTFSLGD